tara:strand:- start:308 stop:619 length:312 start_codon:yes stop_codon:yes gene_type:complete
MTNSDYFIQAAIKKFSERINQKLNEKLDEVTSAAQDAPELLRKEFDSLKNEIIKEANKMQRESNRKADDFSSNSKSTNLIENTSKKLKDIQLQIDTLNQKLDN